LLGALESIITLTKLPLSFFFKKVATRELAKSDQDAFEESTGASNHEEYLPELRL
jgi:hypothetical protein